jgi:hypothetical protein
MAINRNAISFRSWRECKTHCLTSSSLTLTTCCRSLTLQRSAYHPMSPTTKKAPSVNITSLPCKIIAGRGIGYGTGVLNRPPVSYRISVSNRTVSVSYPYRIDRISKRGDRNTSCALQCTNFERSDENSDLARNYRQQLRIRVAAEQANEGNSLAWAQTSQTSLFAISCGYQIRARHRSSAFCRKRLLHSAACRVRDASVRFVAIIHRHEKDRGWGGGYPRKCRHGNYSGRLDFSRPSQEIFRPFDREVRLRFDSAVRRDAFLGVYRTPGSEKFLDALARLAWALHMTAGHCVRTSEWRRLSTSLRPRTAYSPSVPKNHLTGRRLGLIR